MSEATKPQAGEGNPAEEDKTGKQPNSEEETPPAGNEPPASSGTELTAEEKAKFDKFYKDQLASATTTITEKVKTEMEAEREKESKKKQGEFEKLYNDEVAETTRLKAQVEQLKAKIESFQQYLDTEIALRKKSLPKSIVALMPDSDDKFKTLEWLSKASETAKTNDFMPPNPQGGSGAGADEAFKQALEEAEASGIYEN